jgi:ABC-type transporter Mla MlaB component
VIRLSKTKLGSGQIEVRVDGRLDAETVAALAAFIENLTPAAQISFDLSGLASLDAAGVRALIELQIAGHRLKGGSLYVNRLLKEAQP